jgi:hypothetical protein
MALSQKDQRKSASSMQSAVSFSYFASSATPTQTKPAAIQRR